MLALSARLKSCPFKTRSAEVLVVEGFELPLVLGAIVDEEAGDGCAGGGFGKDVPLFGVPAIGGPPVAAGAPRTVCSGDGEAAVAIAKGDGLQGGELDAHREGRTHAAEGEAGRVCGGCGVSSGEFIEAEVSHAEAGGAVSVFEDRRTDAIVAGDGFETGDGDVEARGLGSLRGKEAELDFAGLACFGSEGEGVDGGLRRVGSNLKLEELEEEFAVDGGEGRADDALVSLVAFELHLDGERGKREGARGSTGSEAIDDACADEE